MSQSFSLFARNKLALGGVYFFGLICFIAVLAPVLPLQDPTATDLAEKFLPLFTDGHVLGTDNLGRDLLSRLVWGTRLSLMAGAAAALLAALAGSLIGLFAGFYGGWLDNLFMRIIDMMMAFPHVLLALAIVAALGPGLMNALIAVVIVNIPFFARNVRGVVVTYAYREFVDAARLNGVSNIRIIFTEILPNVMPVITVALSTTLGWMILETAGLSFLGLGTQPPDADLGAMLGESRDALISHPMVAGIIGAMIFLIVISINLIGDGIRDQIDPRLRSGALSSPKARTAREMMHVVETPPKQGSLLDVQQLQVEFRLSGRIFHAVNDVSFSVAPGECLGIVGESGSGKSVTALSVMGLVASPPGVITGGRALFKGEDVIGAEDKRLRQMRGNKVAYIFQDPLSTLHPLMTVGQQLVEAMTLHGKTDKVSARKRAIELLKTVRIASPETRIDNYPYELSGGMRQRVSIAMALANDPDILIADEPTTALDVTVQAQILKLLSDLRRERGLAIIFITHDFGVVSQMCDRVAVMYGGRLVEFGGTQDILARPRHPYTARLMECVPELGSGRRKLAAISGLPPSLDKLPKGCAFAPRCLRAKEDCSRDGVGFVEQNGRLVRCLYPEGVQ